MNNDEVKNLKQGLQTIINLGFDNDGFETVSGLKGLIAEIVEIARSTLKGEFCSVCHGYGWTIIDKETGEVRYCPNCKKPQNDMREHDWYEETMKKAYEEDPIEDYNDQIDRGE